MLKNGKRELWSSFFSCHLDGRDEAMPRLYVSVLRIDSSPPLALREGRGIAQNDKKKKSKNNKKASLDFLCQTGMIKINCSSYKKEVKENVKEKEKTQMV